MESGRPGADEVPRRKNPRFNSRKKHTNAQHDDTANRGAVGERRVPSQEKGEDWENLVKVKYDLCIELYVLDKEVTALRTSLAEKEEESLALAEYSDVYRNQFGEDLIDDDAQPRRMLVLNMRLDELEQEMWSLEKELKAKREEYGDDPRSDLIATIRRQRNEMIILIRENDEIDAEHDREIATHRGANVLEAKYTFEQRAVMIERMERKLDRYTMKGVEAARKLNALESQGRPTKKKVVTLERMRKRLNKIHADKIVKRMDCEALGQKHRHDVEAVRNLTSEEKKPIRHKVQEPSREQRRVYRAGCMKMLMNKISVECHRKGGKEAQQVEKREEGKTQTPAKVDSKERKKKRTCAARRKADRSEPRVSVRNGKGNGALNTLAVHSHATRITERDAISTDNGSRDKSDKKVDDKIKPRRQNNEHDKPQPSLVRRGINGEEDTKPEVEAICQHDVEEEWPADLSPKSRAEEGLIVKDERGEQAEEAGESQVFEYTPRPDEPSADVNRTLSDEGDTDDVVESVIHSSAGSAEKAPELRDTTDDIVESAIHSSAGSAAKDHESRDTTDDIVESAIHSSAGSAEKAPELRDTTDDVVESAIHSSAGSAEKASELRNVGDAESTPSSSSHDLDDSAELWDPDMDASSSSSTAASSSQNSGLEDATDPDDISFDDFEESDSKEIAGLSSPESDHFAASNVAPASEKASSLDANDSSTSPEQSDIDLYLEMSDE